MAEYNEDLVRSRAVTERNKDIIISAGAGSGKTTVLTNRLISHVRDDRKNVTDFLAVTFTNASARDIKDKLASALAEAIAKDPSDVHLQKQLSLVPQANISTISSYCLSIVRENFSSLAVSPNARVLDEAEARMMLADACDELVDEIYEGGDERFLKVAENFTGTKSDVKLVSVLTSLYTDLRVISDPDEFLRGSAEKLYKEADLTEKEGFFACETGKFVQQKLITELTDSLAEMQTFIDCCANVITRVQEIPKLEKMLDAIEAIYAGANDNYVNFASAVPNLVNARLYNPTDDKDMNKSLSDRKSEIVNSAKDVAWRYCHGSEEFIAHEFRETAEITLAIADMLKILDGKYTAKKQNAGAMDYSDFELKTLKLLETEDENGKKVPSAYCLSKSANFEEILIDEYQDVNPLQDRIFSLLATKSHRFMVGDLKQSIYRFRNAYPEIFLGYKDTFKDLDEAGADTARIFLRLNFRCSRTIIDYVNYLFENVTKDSPYYREYDKEWLCYGQKEEYEKHSVVVAIVEKDKKSEDPADDDKNAKISENARLTEADFIASEIQRIIREETDKNGNKLSYKDFAVMLAAMKGYSIPYEKVFTAYGIPFVSETSEDFLANPDVSLAISALKMIDDPTDDISLAAAMRSPIFDFTSDELYKIRKRRENTPFFSAVAAYASPKHKKLKNKKYFIKKRAEKSGLIGKCRNFIRVLTEWRHESAGVPCREFLKSFFVSSGLLNIAIADGNRESLLMLYEYADKYETNAYLGLSGFIEYLGELSKGERSLADVSHSGDEDAVSFITVHKSKGLQFPVCFLAGVDRKFKSVSEKQIMLRRREGISFKLRDKEKLTKCDTVLNITAVDKENIDAVGEELRKLYVALTRAKERLYITGIAPNGFYETPKNPRKANSWLDMMLSLDALGEKAFFDRRTLASRDDVGSGYINRAKAANVDATDEMLKAAAYEYPYKSASEKKAKVSVSELREGLLEDDEYTRPALKIPLSKTSRRPVFASPTAAAGEIGTANHLFMQFCDFENIEKLGVPAEAKRLLENKMFTPEQFDMLDTEALEKFFESSLYKKIKASRRVCREKRFSVSEKLFGDEDILVQGVIDCFFENENGSYTVVDYKTDRVKSEKELVERHKLQLGCYCRAVEGMTGKKVESALLWSFHLGKEIECL